MITLATTRVEPELAANSTRQTTMDGCVNIGHYELGPCFMLRRPTGVPTADTTYGSWLETMTAKALSMDA